jgi:hypothetical protein
MACGESHEGDLSIASAEDLMRARNVSTVHGSLKLGGVNENQELRIAPGDLPCLLRVTGDLWIGGPAITRAGRLELSALEQIDGSLELGLVTDAADEKAEIQLPALRNIGSGASSEPLGLQMGEAQLGGGFFAPSLETVNGPVLVASLIAPAVDLGSLRTVDGDVTFGPAEELAALEVGSLEAVTGALRFHDLASLSFSDIDALSAQVTAPERVISRIGCTREDGDASPDCD